MKLLLKAEVRKRIDDRVKSGRYASAEDVVAAAVMSLDQQERFGDFSAGELSELLAAGERSIAASGTLDGERAFRLRRGRRKSR